MLRFNLIFYLIFFSFFKLSSQSYIDLLNGSTYETIYCEEIKIQGNTVTYKPVDSTNSIEIYQSRLKGYFSASSNTYYHQKNGFKERIVEGELNVYSAIFSKNTYVLAPASNDPSIMSMSRRGESYFKWYLEKGSELVHFYNQKTRSSLAKENNFKKEVLKSKMNDDSISLKELSLLDKNPKIKDLVKIIKDYNVRYFLKTQDNKEIKPDLSKITILRDNNKQAKKPLEFTLEGKKYSLKRNSKVEILIPNNKLSQLCFTNDINNTCELIKSSVNFVKFFELKLNKDDEGDISLVNGNSSYFKTRLAFYEKKSKKSSKTDK